MAKEAAVRLADGVWRIPTAPGDMINSFALAGSDGGVTIVDAGLKLRAGPQAAGGRPGGDRGRARRTCGGSWSPTPTRTTPVGWPRWSR